MRERLVERGVAPERIAVVPNWPPEPVARAAASAEAIRGFRRELGLQEKVIVMYSGNFGLAHAFEGMAQTVRGLGASDPQVAFVFIGDGPSRGWFEGQLTGLRNVVFRPALPLAQLPAALGAADVHLASMRAELCGLMVPSKVYGALMAGRPCVLVGPSGSEAARFIKEHDCGSVVPPDNPEALGECLRGWVADKEGRCQAGERAHQAALSVTLAQALPRWLRALGGPEKGCPSRPSRCA